MPSSVTDGAGVRLVIDEARIGMVHINFILRENVARVYVGYLR